MLYFYLVIKVFIICLIAIGIRGTLPRYRVDQITQYNWKHFVFCWLIFLVITTFIIFVIA